jgi:threonine dehydrogenase-like Zn-dependent dehydrogenase
MRGTVLYGSRDVRFEDVPEPKIEKPTDAIIRLPVTCVRGSDLWSYRGIQSVEEPTPMGHEYCGYVEEVGSAVTSVKTGQFVVGSFAMSDNTCRHCLFGYLVVLSETGVGESGASTLYARGAGRWNSRADLRFAFGRTIAQPAGGF